MDINKALMSLGGRAMEEPTKVIDMKDSANAQPKVLTKKQQEALDAQKKLEKAKAKAAAMVAGLGAGAKEKKPKKEKVDKKKAGEGTAAASASGAATDGGAATSTDAADSAPSSDPVVGTGKAKAPLPAKVITMEERRKAVDAQRKAAAKAELAFQQAYSHQTTTVAITLDVVPMDYTVRTADELDAARVEAERAAAAAAKETAESKLEAAIQAAIAKRGCEVTTAEWAVLRLASLD